MSAAESALLLLAVCFYALRAAASVRRFFRANVTSAPVAWATLAPALLLHTAFLAARACAVRGLPSATRLDSVALFLWAVAVAYVVCQRPYKLSGTAPVFWSIFSVAALGAWLFADRTAAAPASLDRFWLALHLVPVYAGYAAFALASVVSVAYLVQGRLLRAKGSGGLWRRLPSLETLERVGQAALSLGFPALTVGLVAGVLWAGRPSAPLGRAWWADPKVVGGLVVWLFYAAVLHARLFVRVRGKRAALLTIVGFLLTVASFLAAHLYQEAPPPPPPPASSAQADVL